MGILLEYDKDNVPQFKYFVSNISLKAFIKENKLSRTILYEDDSFNQQSLDDIENNVIKDLVYWVSNKDIVDIIKDEKSNSITFIINNESQIEDMISAIKAGKKFSDIENGVLYENTPIVFVTSKDKHKRNYFIEKLNAHAEKTDTTEQPEATKEEPNTGEEKLHLKTGFETLKKEYDSGSHPVLNDDNLSGKKIELTNNSIDIFVNSKDSQKLIVQWLNKSGIDQGKETTVKDNMIFIGTNKYNVIISEETSEEEIKAELDKKYSKENILEYLKKNIKPDQLISNNAAKDIVFKKDKNITIYVVNEKAKKNILNQIVKDFKDMTAVSNKNGNGVAIHDIIITVIDPTEIDKEEQITKQLTKDLQQNMSDKYKSAIERGIGYGSSFADELETQY